MRQARRATPGKIYTHLTYENAQKDPSTPRKALCGVPEMTNLRGGFTITRPFVAAPLLEDNVEEPPESVCRFCWETYREDAIAWANERRAPMLAGMRIKVGDVLGHVVRLAPPPSRNLKVMWQTCDGEFLWVARQDAEHDYTCPMTCGGLLAWANAEMSEAAAYNPAIMPILHTLDAARVWHDVAVREVIEEVEAVLRAISRSGANGAPH